MQLTDQQKEKLRSELHEECGIYLYGNEIDKLLQIVQRHTRSFSKAIEQDEEETNIDNPRFLGKRGYDEEEDQGRLTKQLFAVLDFLSDEEWHTQFDIAKGASVNITSIRSRLSDLRMPRWGAHKVLSERVKGGNGLWRYKLVPNKNSLTWKEYLKQKNAASASK